MRIDGKITQGKSVILLDLLVNGDGDGGGVFVKIVNDTPGEVGTLVFSHYGKALSLTVPPDAINLS